MPAGRKTELDDELCLTIRDYVLKGKTQEEIAGLIKVPFDTVQGWVTRNYKGFADKWLLYKHEYKLSKAEDNIEKILEMTTGEENGSGLLVDSRVLRIKADMSTFVAETLGKKNYSKRTELTGADGKDLVTPQDVNDRIENLRNPS